MSEHTTKANIVEKPSPVRDERSEPFFAGAQQGRLMIKQCDACQVFAPPAEEYCTNCMTQLGWAQASGKGTLFTWSIVNQAFHPGFAQEVPYVIGIVKLEEGPRIHTRIIDVDYKDLKIGLELQVRFEECPNGESLPVFTYR
jgi:uncharacterized OB-fold protein